MKFTDKCYNCDKLGHSISECRQPRRGGNNHNNQVVLEIKNALLIPRESPKNCRVGVFEGIQEVDLILVESSLRL
jgi:hypothetical protein